MWLERVSGYLLPLSSKPPPLGLKGWYSPCVHYRSKPTEEQEVSSPCSSLGAVGSLSTPFTHLPLQSLVGCRAASASRQTPLRSP